MEADYDVTKRAMEGMDRTQSTADDRLMIRFETFPHPNEQRSTEAGHPVYDDREYITIIVPGDKTSIVHRPVWAQDKQRFPRQYQAFKAGLSQEASGLPLKMWGGMTQGQAKEFEYFNVKTVEQLAVMADGNGVGIQGFNGLKQRAVDYLAYTKEQQPLLEMRGAIEKRDNEIATLMQALKEQGERTTRLEALVPKSKLKELVAEEEDA